MPLLRTVSTAHVRGLAMVLATLLLPGKAQAQQLMVAVTDSAGAAVDDAIVALYAENAIAGPEPTPQVHVVDQVGKQFAPRIAAIQQERHAVVVDQRASQVVQARASLALPVALDEDAALSPLEREFKALKRDQN